MISPRTSSLPNTRPSGGLDTPFMQAEQIWDIRLGTARAQVTRWQIACGLLALIALLAVYGVIDQARKAMVVAYVVEVSTDGEVRVVLPLPTTYVPTRAAAEQQVRRFLTATRALSTDMMVVRREWVWAYSQVTDKGKNLLNSRTQATNPFEEVGKKIVDIEVLRCIPASDASFDVTWRETVLDAKGNPLVEQGGLYSGLVTLVLRPPKNEQEVRTNPLGIWIDHFSFSKKDAS